MKTNITIMTKRRGKYAIGILAALVIFSYVSLQHFQFFINHFWSVASGRKEYILLLQNNNELRPGGGFVTAYANVTLHWGVPTRLAFHNSYEIDTKAYIKPPYPQEELLKDARYQGYTFRDANWNPNFPDAAADIVHFYEQKFPQEHIDGLMVVNFNVIEKLLAEVGSIDLGDKVVDHQSLFSALEFEVNNVDRHNVEALGGRKNVLKDLGYALMKKTIWHPFTTLSVMNTAIDEKDFYFWFRDEALQEKISALGWANDLLLPEKTDFLGVNLANLGSKKADRYLIKNTEYYVDLSGSEPTMHVKVALNFPGKLNSYSDPYRGYLRVIIPGNAKVTHQPEGSQIENLGALKSIGAIVNLGASSSGEWTFDYTLPRRTFKTDEYALKLQKQSGDMMHYLVVVSGANETQLKSNQFDVRENKAFFRGTLLNDLILGLHINPDATPPYPIEQRFDSLNQISIIWSEPITSDTAHALKKYSIRDMNVTNAAITDIPKIEQIDVDQNVTRLKLSGITAQPLEQYQIIMTDMKDRGQNVIEPNPKTITAVQRI